MFTAKNEPHWWLTGEENVRVTACQYILGGTAAVDGGLNTSFCFNSTIRVKVALLADTRICRLASCLKDSRVSITDMGYIPTLTSMT